MSPTHQTTEGSSARDSPLVWGDLEESVAGRQQALDSADIEITFPVGKNAALVSYPRARDATCDSTDEVVGHINMRTLQLSMGQVFHCDDDFLLQRRSGEIARGSEYFAYVADARRRGIIRP